MKTLRLLFIHSPTIFDKKINIPHTTATYDYHVRHQDAKKTDSSCMEEGNKTGLIPEPGSYCMMIDIQTDSPICRLLLDKRSGDPPHLGTTSV